MGCAYRQRAARWLAGVAALLSGCASLEPLEHPRAWVSAAAARFDNGCPDLSGTYVTQAQGAYPAHVASRPKLQEILAPDVLRVPDARDRPWPRLADATRATLTSTAGELHVRFGDEAGGEAVLRFRRLAWWGGAVAGADALYQCRELELGPAIGLDAARRPVFSIPYLVGVGDFDFVFLSKAADGALIVNHRVDRVVLTGILIGSHAQWTGSLWWRFAPVGTTP